jgi:glycosyltransferase involved in cell wall biosynthesis
MAIVSKGIGFYKDAPVALLAKLFGVKTIYHFHNKGVKLRQDYLIDHLLYRLVFHRSRAILLSEHIYPDVQKYIPRNRVYICPNGMPEQELPKTDKTILPGTAPVQVLFLSNLIRSKGIFELLNACIILKNHRCNFQCTFVGGIGDVTESEFNHFVKTNGIADCVLYAGKKYGGDKERILATTDIFVHPTYEDCMPLVLIEAMQHALPVISTPEGAIPDMVNDGITGFLVPRKDVTLLAEKIKLLITDPDLRIKMGEAGYRKYQEEFTLKSFEKKFLNIITENLSYS